MGAPNLGILTPESRNGLVWREAVSALAGLGHSVHVVPDAEMTVPAMRRLFSLPPHRSGLESHPALFLSVNFHGLDKHGDVFAVFRSKGVPVAIWLVDNPWNLLSGLRTDFWKEAHLFVTDPFFISGLKAHGARHVSFLPLATDPALFSPGHRSENPQQTRFPVVFVGRSAFPDKNRFFIGQSIPENLEAEANTALASGTRPDFSWWLKKLKLDNNSLWPGSAFRKASLGAEEMSLLWRAECLRQAAAIGLLIYGDAGWTDILPSNGVTKLLGPVDYYTSLARIYACAPFSLNMVSFLLPHGLNQRHFDVWSSGGFCIMDACPGLDIFPPELVAPISFRDPTQIPAIVERFIQAPEEKRTLTALWRKTILAEHTYDVRMQSLLRSLFF